MVWLMVAITLGALALIFESLHLIFRPSPGKRRASARSRDIGDSGE